MNSKLPLNSWFPLKMNLLFIEYKPKSCKELYQAGLRSNGVYTIYDTNSTSYNVGRIRKFYLHKSRPNPELYKKLSVNELARTKQQNLPKVHLNAIYRRSIVI